jgi:hypothetical protein
MLVTVKKIFKNSYRWDGNEAEAKVFFGDSFVEVVDGILYIDRHDGDCYHYTTPVKMHDIVIANSYSDEILPAEQAGIMYEYEKQTGDKL